MMKKLLWMPALTLLAMMASCGNDDEDVTTSSFTVEIPQGCLAPCEATFNNTSQGATSYSWDFGDGNTSTDENPKHTYRSGGTFSVTLTVQGAGGSNSSTQQVEIAAPSRMIINTISVFSFPALTQAGVTWDLAPNEEPDLIVQVQDPNGNAVQGQEQYDDANVDNAPFDFTVGAAVPSGLNFAVVLGDLDENNQAQTMASAILNEAFWTQVTTGNQSYSNSININAGTVQFGMSVTWQE